jgi:hypothetical protein
MASIRWRPSTIDAVVSYVVELELAGGASPAESAPGPSADSEPDSPLDDEVSRLERELGFRS